MFKYIIAVGQYPTYQVFLTSVLTLLLTIFLTPLWIKISRGRDIGQIVRLDGPREHLQKAGTPTMGGLFLLFTITFVYLLMALPKGYSGVSVLALLTALACGLLGFFDDYSKVIGERSLGLLARTKLIWQLVISFLLGWGAINYCHLSTSVVVPLTSFKLDLGWLYYVFLFIIVASATNGVNLTDGLDGLAGGTISIVMMAYAGIAFRQNRLDLAIFCAAVGGACIGFLWYNSFPAEIFMGDTGSLGFGGAIAALAILTKTELLLLLIGGIYVAETLSVIIQVISFKYFKGRRVFKMAPLHHHFEMQGWSETKVMIRFWIIAGVLAGTGFALYFVFAVK
jgi:phospho-N-acetylmuramoyl-pentapeptide-transferase